MFAANNETLLPTLTINNVNNDNDDDNVNNDDVDDDVKQRKTNIPTYHQPMNTRVKM